MNYQNKTIEELNNIHYNTLKKFWKDIGYYNKDNHNSKEKIINDIYKHYNNNNDNNNNDNNNDDDNNYYEMKPMSEEQLNIVEKFSNNNIVVNAVAGSGKTTTSLHIAKEYKDKKILLVTYNKKLKDETRIKVEKLKLTNFDVQSYNSLCVKYYTYEGKTDIGIVKTIKENLEKNKNIKYDAIILDEIQDMTELYFEFICKFCKDNSNKFNICLFGDINQTIYQFKGADCRFITYADKIFNFNDLNWIKLKLSVSFRLNNKTADFINNCMLNNSMINYIKNTNIKPKYIICNTFLKSVYNEFKSLLKMNYKPEEIFILAYSTKNEGTPIRKLENKIKNEHKDIYIHISMDEEERLDEKEIENKLVFSTFHQTKGLERKVILVFGFDDYNNNIRNKTPNKCWNELYVACTRSTERLILFHDNRNNFLQFLNINKLKEYCDIKNVNKIKIQNKHKEIKPTDVTDLLKNIPVKLLMECYQKLIITVVDTEKTNIKIPNKVKSINIEKNTDNTESISDINGIAIPAIYEFKNKNKTTIWDFCTNVSNIINYFKNIKRYLTSEMNAFIIKHSDIIKNINHDNIIDNIIYITLVYYTIKTGFLFKIEQIKDYNWLSDDIKNDCLKNLSSLNIDNTYSYEKLIIYTYKNIELHGRADCINDNTIYEIKSVNELKPEHYLQIAIYKFMFEFENKKKYNAFLYNILSNELIEVSYELNDIYEILNLLIDNKLKEKNDVNDEDFIKNMNIINKKYII